jgi:hypothetical protein
MVAQPPSPAPAEVRLLPQEQVGNCRFSGRFVATSNAVERFGENVIVTALQTLRQEVERGEGYLIATVRLYYGIDLKSLAEDAVQIAGGTICVTLPDPKELDFSVDLDNAKFLSKRSGLIVLRDLLRNLNFRQELERQLRQAAEEMLGRARLLPKRRDLLLRLNAWAPALCSKCGVRVVFR